MYVRTIKQYTLYTVEGDVMAHTLHVTDNVMLPIMTKRFKIYILMCINR